MLPSGLVGAIETLRGRIERHRPALSQSEALTRYALIDPLLRELGWDTADPDLVTPEYSVSGKRADYALLESGNVVVFLEAKRLEENLSNHRSQVVAYASELGIRYPALTNGNEWEVYDNSQLVPIDQRRILTVSLTGAPPPVNALQLLLLWRPNLSSGEPVAAMEPIVAPVEPAPAVPNITPSPVQPFVAPPPATPAGGASVSARNTPVNEGRIPLTKFQATTGQRPPAYIRFPNEEQRHIGSWVSIFVYVAEWLIQSGKLTESHCPIRGNLRTRYIVHYEPRHADGKSFDSPHQLSNGLFIHSKLNATDVISYSSQLLRHCGVDAASVHLEP